MTGDQTWPVETPARPTIRRASAADMDAVDAAFRRALGRGDMAGSSDPQGTFMMDVIRLQPHETAVATVADELVGLVQPEFKALVVEPAWRRRGIARALVAEAVAIERERGRPNVLMGPPPGDAGALAFLRATGFQLHSTVWDMRLAPDAAAAAPRWPDGIVARAFDRTRDVAPFVELSNLAFAEHPTPLVLSVAAVEASLLDDRYADADTLVLEAPDGSLVGFCLTAPDRVGGAIIAAEIAEIGVAPGRRGEGLGRALLAWGVEHLRSLGATAVTLAVNGRNEGALRLYEREGFTRVLARERWALPVEPGAA